MQFQIAADFPPVLVGDWSFTHVSVGVPMEGLQQLPIRIFILESCS